MKYNTSFHIANREISIASDVYFIADIAANHDGDLERAKALIWQAKEAGAHAAKFQHFLASKIVSDVGFKNLGGQMAHQASWKKSVYEIYEQYEYKRVWDQALYEEAQKAEIDWMSTPYDFDATQSIADRVPAFKIGSGDITWIDSVANIAQQGKPVLLATGASVIDDVIRAVDAILAHNRDICLMQCNTNYTGSLQNFKYINLNVLKTFATMYPGMVLGLSDHTPGHSAVLGAVALGARVVEKHFTDDNNREGPDHPFSMNPVSWREMVDRSMEVRYALGDGVKRIEGNEVDSAIVQRRCLRATTDLSAGTLLDASHVEALRPAPNGSVLPYEMSALLGTTLKRDMVKGEAFYHDDIA